METTCTFILTSVLSFYCVFVVIPGTAVSAVECFGQYAFIRTPGKFGYGSTLYNVDNTLDKCKIRCSNLLACVSFDFNYGTNLCWIHFTNVELLYSGTDFDHYERISCPPTVITPSLPLYCFGQYAFSKKADKYGFGAVLYNSEKTAHACQMRCSNLATCTSVDFNHVENTCWLFFTNVESTLSFSSYFDHYEKISCPTTTLPPTIPYCVNNKHHFNEFKDIYAFGGTEQAGINTVIGCLELCGDTFSCTAADFNTNTNTCYFHTGDPDSLQLHTSSDTGGLFHYVKQSCSTTLDPTASTTVPDVNAPVKFTALLTNDYDAAVHSDPDAFIDTFRTEFCDDTGIRCSRLLRPKYAEDVEKVTVKENPGPEVGSIRVKGELSPGVFGETNTQYVMERFKRDLFQNFRHRLGPENGQIQLTPDTSSAYDGFSWERISDSDSESVEQTDPTEAPLDACFGQYSFDLKANRYAFGAQRYGSVVTVDQCKTGCSATDSCTSIDFNYELNECWVHTTNVEDDLRNAADVDHFERVPCSSTATPLYSTKRKPYDEDDPVVRFKAHFYNDFHATISDTEAFITRFRTEFCDATRISCSRLIRPRDHSDVYSVTSNTDPGPKIGSIVVEGEVIQEVENGISTETMMEAFQHYLFRQFKIQLSAENDYVSLEPDISTEYDGFSWGIDDVSGSAASWMFRGVLGKICIMMALFWLTIF